MRKLVTNRWVYSGLVSSGDVDGVSRLLESLLVCS